MFTRDKASFSRPWKYFALAIIVAVVAGYFAYKNYFIQDDAYISYVYAGHFAHGDGLVWYPGSNEFGYTSFLYTLLIGVGIFLGLDPEWASAGINIAAYFASLYLACRLTWRLSSSYLAGICVGIVLATQHDFSAYASSGLETMMVTAFVLAFYDRFLTVLKTPAKDGAVSLGILAACALLTRLDSALLLFPGYVYLFIQSLDTWRTQPRKVLRHWLVQGGIPAMAVMALLYGCWHYYGWPLPTSFYLKIPDNGSRLPTGIYYLVKYLTLQCFIPYLILFLICNHYLRFLRDRNKATYYQYFLVLAAVIALWLVYILYIGGDFMAFRLLVPILPFFALIAFSTSALSFDHSSAKKLALLAAIFLIGNATEDYDFRTPPDEYILADTAIESTEGLYAWMHKPEVNWREVGKALHTLFYTGHPDDVKIAVGPAGAIPYYSGLPSVDLLGLNSRDMQADSHKAGDKPKPGHWIMANDSFISSQHVNLNVLHPQTLCGENAQKTGDLTWTKNPINEFIYVHHETLLLPINPSCYLVVDYRLRHPKIDALLANGTILRYKDVSERAHCPAWLCP